MFNVNYYRYKYKCANPKGLPYGINYYLDHNIVIFDSGINV